MTIKVSEKMAKWFKEEYFSATPHERYEAMLKIGMDESLAYEMLDAKLEHLYLTRCQIEEENNKTILEEIFPIQERLERATERLHVVRMKVISLIWTLF